MPGKYSYRHSVPLEKIEEEVDWVKSQGYKPAGIVLNLRVFLLLKKQLGHERIGKNPFSLKVGDNLLPVFYTPLVQGKTAPPISIIATELPAY